MAADEEAQKIFKFVGYRSIYTTLIDTGYCSNMIEVFNSNFFDAMAYIQIKNIST